MLLLSTLISPLSTFGQGTAFTYQGVVSFNGAPATGVYDLSFAAYDALSGGAVQGVTNLFSSLSLTNGRLTATLDFGANVFTGADRFLQMAIRTNGGGAFSTLAPRQSILPTPYAITAGNAVTATVANTASSVAAANISGTVALSQLAANSVDGSKILDGSIANVDIAAGAAIVDTKLATLATAGKVADTALSANVALRSGGNLFTGNQTITNGTLFLNKDFTNTDVTAPYANYTLSLNNPNTTSNQMSGLAFSTGSAGQGSSAAIMARTVAPIGGSPGTGAGQLLFYTTGTDSLIHERMRLDQAGNFGIGTTAPAAKGRHGQGHGLRRRWRGVDESA